MCVFDQCGQSIDMEKATEFFELVWTIISDAFKYSNENCSNISPKTSLKDFFTQKVNEKGLSEEDQTLILQLAEMWGAFIGDPWDQQSLKYFWLEECLDGGEFPPPPPPLSPQQAISEPKAPCDGLGNRRSFDADGTVL
jgi:hypothetical protein